jgi:two-component system cell cycle response regulator
VSIGVAALPIHASKPDDLIVLADRALYGAKQAGRNRILIGSTQLPAPPQAVAKFEIDDTVLDILCRLEDEMEGYQAPNEHSSAVGRWAGIVALHAGFDDEARARCELAGRLHDIGKIVVAPEILAKSDPLTAEEWRIVSMHADHGSRLLYAFGAGEATAQVVAQHHERYDGNGYPGGLARDEIRIEARVLAICDSWAAMRADRPYRIALSVEQALDQLRLGRGGQFDPDLNDLFIDLVEQGIVGGLGQLVGVLPRPPALLTTPALGRIA